MTRHLPYFNLDLIGFSTSMLCALHCATLPFLISLAPLSGLQFFINPWFEFLTIFVSFFIAYPVLVHGYCRHHQKAYALIFVTIGFLLIGGGYFLKSELKEIFMTSIGAMLVATAHIINWRFTNQSKNGYRECMKSKVQKH